jgi:trehalose 6-phosphate phosphatase
MSLFPADLAAIRHCEKDADGHAVFKRPCMVKMAWTPPAGIFHIRFDTVWPMSSNTARPNNPLPAPPLPGADARWALLLDIDGTLLDFSDDPASVAASPALIGLLHDLHAALDGALALISGRTLDDIDRIVGHRHWAAAGLHGTELRRADGSFRRGHVSAISQALMRQAANDLAARFEGVLVEDKEQAMALHCRNDPDQLAALQAAAGELQLADYELQPGREVLEFRPAGMDKGEAVRQLLDCAPFVGRTPVYLGDDLTDEQAFKRVNRVEGISVRVGLREPTQARFTLADPVATLAWLGRVLDATSHGNPFA